MTLSIDAAVGDNANENLSPVDPSPKRKSDLISPSCHHNDKVPRSPLADVNSAATAAASSTPSKPPTPSRLSLPPTYGHRFNAAKFKPRPSRDEIQATDEKQASVSQLSGWLASESAKKKKSKPPIIHHASPKISFNSKPRIKKSDVEATDDKRVSVKTLSSWMNDDPFEQKKVRTIRSGPRVITKSRVFEKDEKLAAKCDIKAGAVGERSAWLSGAFKHEEEGSRPPQPIREKKLRPYQIKKEEVVERELKSVKDKKEWLSNAFKKGGDSPGDVLQKGSGTPCIQQTKSFEVDQHNTMGIQQAKSFEINSIASNPAAIPSLAKCASADANDSRHTIHETKSCDGTTGARTGVPPTILERQRSVVRLYKSVEKDEEVESPENTLKTVHDKQAWLSSAFKKKPGAAAVGKNDRGAEKATPSGVVRDEKDAEKSMSAIAEKSNSDAEKKLEENSAAQARNMDEKEVVVVDLSERVKNNRCAPPAKESSNRHNDNDAEKADKMSVADRAKWLKGAFK